MSLKVINVRGIKDAESRKGICYVGRKCFGWPHHSLANPFKPTDVKYASLTGDPARKRQACLADYRAWLLALPNVEELLAELWADTKQGQIPIGCWCHPQSCHGDILAAELYKRFVS